MKQTKTQKDSISLFDSFAFKNKRGQLDFLGNIISTIPKPVLFLLFISLLSIFGLLMNPLLNSFGIFCDTSQTVVKIQDGNIFTNAKLMSSLPGFDELSADFLDPNNDLFGLVQCTESVNGTYRLVDTKCTTCDHIEGVIPRFDSSLYLCAGDAFRTSNDDLNWFKEKIYCPSADCRIPQGYYYDSEDGLYVCLGDCSSQTAFTLRDQKLYDAGARPLYPTLDSSPRFENTFIYSCSDKLRVQPSIKGIPIFSLELWAIVILIVLLLWGIMRFRPK